MVGFFQYALNSLSLYFKSPIFFVRLLTSCSIQSRRRICSAFFTCWGILLNSSLHLSRSLFNWKSCASIIWSWLARTVDDSCEMLILVGASYDREGGDLEFSSAVWERWWNISWTAWPCSCDWRACIAALVFGFHCSGWGGERLRMGD